MTPIDFLDYNPELYKELLKNEVNFEHFPSVSAKDDFQSSYIQLPSENYAHELRNQIQPISMLAESRGYAPNIFTALYEAVLNAHQHGNKLSEEKQIKVSHRINSEKLEIIVEDEGRKLPEYFVPFLINLRSKIGNEGKFVDWYKFSNAKKPSTNNGTGTSFMHTYLDSVMYMRSEELSGLAVYMTKNK